LWAGWDLVETWAEAGRGLLLIEVTDMIGRVKECEVELGF
jgi:hypothetical protein